METHLFERILTLLCASPAVWHQTVEKPRRVSRPQTRKIYYLFSAATCAWQKTLCAERASSCPLSADNRGAERSEAFSKKWLRYFFDSLFMSCGGGVNPPLAPPDFRRTATRPVTCICPPSRHYDSRAPSSAPIVPLPRKRFALSVTDSASPLSIPPLPFRRSGYCIRSPRGL